ncbi:hypothetical protein K431DRAFT_291068 [Polychaeton citri CBS 116435]|uniref:RRM domain-containing protein n=1 Tax=Polychaeton citri CBS 116435 TaxID=1314669 RepID=A0A9P4UTM5_9PEZI|nr:hypothetical protein K431DRAFT_291068 [Polychaeton citri CBS 116435]
MAEKNVSFDAIIQAGRKKRKAEELANEIMGKNSRSSAPITQRATGGSLASRVGVTKRTSSLPRTGVGRARNQRNAPSNLGRPPLNETNRTKSTPILPTRSGRAAPAQAIVDVGSGLSIRGAAGSTGPFVVMASNFAEGTTAADISSVMANVGGETPKCRIMQKFPTVMAEMVFQDRRGAENVIETFNNQKADGRVLYVYMKNGGPAPEGPVNLQAQPEPEPEPMGGALDEEMEVDENVESREHQDRLREERRGRDERARRNDLPRGPRSERRYNDGYYGRDDRQPPASYQGGRYDLQGRGRGGSYGGRGRGHNEGRMYSDNMRSGIWQSYR